ncbi:MAG: arginyl-tRNA synthetase [candidate division WWE3 bacterium GW2011_GWF2_41_45]|uniref:Arginine--tRNA ligase n=3 Tax=Katanobacteria TaxID=422282 RepID=A0A0G0VPA4_UNCKA|nr:MAG: arginyl-tRNA synthetase [candidate division WWE3 bacterium GW2011_GWC2_41_23]KKS10216.1 MAG: arginyl-tRNA synthetase [candidate division WWE3 bacterium GW2011_GWF2_41_45]KKS19558.1 MAG: arginyl-tRNA synthetase [candidate division WWE3 bacterium GW2011_GWE1_41_72]KKS28411.1 MAG: arginyl-tRNA synthetase [candidate division WWE3 bacterium GW2011_GWD2_42_11]KKS50504.1 MAG: arginyl-tRNA synthetase [candidate division WWE3 bacterium GW2011_GWE2_42_25]KKS63785.1 MAG: arginyl-tRNA synthetase [
MMLLSMENRKSGINKTAQDLISKAVHKLYGLDKLTISVDVPENGSFGDYSTNISFVIAKTLDRIPFEIATEVAHELSSENPKIEFEGTLYSIFEKIEPHAPGFVNFTLSDKFLFHNTMDINLLNETYGSSDFGKGRKVIVEYSQPNTNKPQHIGHARNNFIGSSLSKILAFCGYDVVKTNYVGDIGIHICKSMLMYIKHGNDGLPDKKSDHFVGDFYTMYEKEFEKNPGIEKEAQDLLRRWESGDKEVRAVWEKMNSWVYEGWKKTYSDQKVEFDVWEHESEKIDVGKEIALLSLEKGLAEKDETGAIIARLEKYGLPDKVLLRSDGTSVYSTKELQLAKDSFEKYKFDKRLYVVDVRQSDYFKQLFKIIELLGFDWSDRLVHIAYGMVSLPQGKMSSRTGLVVNADDVLEDLTSLEEEEIRNSIKMPKIVRETAEKVALAAFKYGMLKVDTKQDVIFNYEHVTKFEGNTGPYLLYTYARARSVLEKGGFEIEGGKFKYESIPKEFSMHLKERALASVLVHFPEYVLKSAGEYAPNQIANYAYEIAQNFNSFYGELPILDASPESLKKFRLYLTHATMVVLKQSLSLLGIEVVEKM